MPDEEDVSSRLDSRTLAFTLRVLLPGGVIYFLLLRFEPNILDTTPSTVFVGVFAFFMFGFLSSSSYRALCRLASRLTPQLRRAREIVDDETEDEKREWVVVRALYVEWRQMHASDVTLKYAARMAPYVHAGYQVALVFGFFFVAKSLDLVGMKLFGGLDFYSQIVLGILASVFAIAALFEDRELNSIERDFLEREEQNFQNHVRITLKTYSRKQF